MQPQGPYSQTPAPGNLPAGYEFLSGGSAPQKTTSGPSSTLKRVLVVAIGLIILIVLFTVVKGLLSGGSNKPQLLSVIQDQTVLIHLSTDAQEQKALSVMNKNFAITTQLSLSSERSQLLSYANKNGAKFKPKQVSLKLSLATDQKLAAASTASTYDSTFKEVMLAKLSLYKSDLKQAFAKTKGTNGRALLSKQYDSADLLSRQLGY